MIEGPFKKYSSGFSFNGFPLFYIVEGECWCASCCNKELAAEDERFTPIDHPARNNDKFNEEITESWNQDNPDLRCSQCLEQIEAAAYGNS